MTLQREIANRTDEFVREIAEKILGSYPDQDLAGFSLGMPIIAEKVAIGEIMMVLGEAAEFPKDQLDQMRAALKVMRDALADHYKFLVNASKKVN